jgi:hypothetical protein
MSRGGFSSCMKAMCKICMEGMINSLNTDVTDSHGNKLKRSRRHILEYMTSQKRSVYFILAHVIMILRRVFRKRVISHTWRSLTEMVCEKPGRLIRFSTRIAWRAVHLCFLPMRVVISIDYDMCLSLVLLMAGAWWILHSGWLVHCHDAPQYDGLSGRGR